MGAYIIREGATRLTATGTHVPYGIKQCYLPPGRGDIPARRPTFQKIMYVHLSHGDDCDDDDGDDDDDDDIVAAAAGDVPPKWRIRSSCWGKGFWGLCPKRECRG